MTYLQFALIALYNKVVVYSVCPAWPGSGKFSDKEGFDPSTLISLFDKKPPLVYTVYDNDVIDIITLKNKSAEP